MIQDTGIPTPPNGADTDIRTRLIHRRVRQRKLISSGICGHEGTYGSTKRRPIRRPSGSEQRGWRVKAEGALRKCGAACAAAPVNRTARPVVASVEARGAATVAATHNRGDCRADLLDRRPVWRPGEMPQRRRLCAVPEPQLDPAGGCRTRHAYAAGDSLPLDGQEPSKIATHVAPLPWRRRRRARLGGI